MHWVTFQYLISQFFLLSTIVLCFLVKIRFLDISAVFNFKYFLARTDSLCAALLSSAQASRDKDDLLIEQFSILKPVTEEVREDSLIGLGCWDIACHHAKQSLYALRNIWPHVILIRHISGVLQNIVTHWPRQIYLWSGTSCLVIQNSVLIL